VGSSREALAAKPAGVVPPPKPDASGKWSWLQTGNSATALKAKKPAGAFRKKGGRGSVLPFSDAAGETPSTPH
jgi:hypothetical protein